MVDMQEKSKTVEYEIYEHVHGIVSKVTTYEEVINILGEPELVEISDMDGCKMLNYSSMGIIVVIARDDISKHNPTVAITYLLPPFSKVSSNGVYRGTGFYLSAN